MPQREQLASTPEPPLPNGKEQSRLSRAPNHGRRGESQGRPELHLDKREEDQRSDPAHKIKE